MTKKIVFPDCSFETAFQATKIDRGSYYAMRRSTWKKHIFVKAAYPDGFSFENLARILPPQNS